MSTKTNTYRAVSVREEKGLTAEVEVTHIEAGSHTEAAAHALDSTPSPWAVVEVMRVPVPAEVGACSCWAGPVSLHSGHCCLAEDDREDDHEADPWALPCGHGEDARLMFEAYRALTATN